MFKKFTSLLLIAVAAIVFSVAPVKAGCGHTNDPGCSFAPPAPPERSPVSIFWLVIAFAVTA